MLSLDPDPVKAARMYYRDHLQKSFVDTEAGRVVFTGKGSSKLRSKVFGNAKTAELIPAIKPVLTHGHYLGREALHKTRKDNAVAFHKFEGVVDIAGDGILFRVDVLESKEGKLFYSIEDIRPASSYPSVSRGTSRPAAIIATDSIDTHTAQKFLIKRFGPKFTHLSESGRVKLVASESDLPEGITDIKGDGAIQGAYDPATDTAYIVTGNTPKGDLAGVLLHELMHGFNETAAGKKLVQRMARMQERAKVKEARAWFRKAEQSVPEGTKAEDIPNEIAAYAAQQFEQGAGMPHGIMECAAIYISLGRPSVSGDGLLMATQLI